MVGGTIPEHMAPMVAISSSDPAAPNPWPCIALVEDTRTLSAAGPNAARIALLSVGSFAGVPVPCAFT